MKLGNIRPGDYILYNTDFSFGVEGLVVGFNKTSTKTRDPMSACGEVHILTRGRGVVSISLMKDDMVNVALRVRRIP